MATKTRFSKDQIEKLELRCQEIGVEFLGSDSSWGKVHVKAAGKTYGFTHYYSADDFLTGIQVGEKRARDACFKIVQDVKEETRKKEQALNSIPRVTIYSTGELWHAEVRQFGLMPAPIVHQSLPTFRAETALNVVLSLFNNQVVVTLKKE